MSPRIVRHADRQISARELSLFVLSAPVIMAGRSMYPTRLLLSAYRSFHCALSAATVAPVVFQRWTRMRSVTLFLSVATRIPVI